MGKEEISIIFILLVLVVLSGCALGWSGEGRDSSIDYSDAFEEQDFSCPSGQVMCNGRCVDVMVDHENCGRCGNGCDDVQVCDAGVCSYECPEGMIACDGGCVDVRSNPLNCGSCGNVCSGGDNATPICENGVCEIVCDEGWSDMDGDGSCETNCVPSTEEELCNGVDDNCDGRVDEGFECRMGHVVSCTTTCGSQGTGACGIDCRSPPPEHCIPPEELCNGEDDDCDGVCDNGFECCEGQSESCVTLCGSEGRKICSSVCLWSDCIPPEELCNGEDDDCDGVCDNGAGMACCAGREQVEECGNCGTRSRVCLDSCVWGSWSDCINEGECSEGETRQCGRCGTQRCTSTCRWGECAGEGECDPGNTTLCTTTCGSTGMKTCTDSCTWGACMPPEEIFNFRDDDCDTIVDNGFSLLVYGYDDCTGAGGSCPPGYHPRGQFKVQSQECGAPGFTGVDYSGYGMDAGWLQLCSPTDDVILAKGWDDCSGTSGGGCPSGYHERGTFKVDPGSCGGGVTGVSYDGQELRSGWLHLCSRSSRESLVVFYDYCTGSSGGCPSGTIQMGRWIPEVRDDCNTSYPTSVTTDGNPHNYVWLVYCVEE